MWACKDERTRRVHENFTVCLQPCTLSTAECTMLAESPGGWSQPGAAGGRAGVSWRGTPGLQRQAGPRRGSMAAAARPPHAAGAAAGGGQRVSGMCLPRAHAGRAEHSGSGEGGGGSSESSAPPWDAGLSRCLLITHHVARGLIQAKEREHTLEDDSGALSRHALRRHVRARLAPTHGVAPHAHNG
jgi:hypothetical protein